MTRTSSAALVEYLVSYDGPQLALLKTDRNRNMLAHAVHRADMKEPFFGCEVPDKAFEKYFEGTADLHYAFQHAMRDAYYFFDNAFVEGEGDIVRLVGANKIDLENPEYWPRIGIFSRSHTSLYNRERRETSLKTFKIDGRWGAEDFSHFYGKMSDLYSLFAVLTRFEGASAPVERAFFAQALRDRLFRGGGSYIGFYDDLDNQNSKNKVAQLEVSRIQYASPGQIDLRGDATALASTSDVIAIFEDHSTALTELYNKIHGTLRREKLLKAEPTAEFSSRAIQEFVHLRSMELALALKIESVEEIFKAASSNVLVFAKLILSIYRRARELYMFEAEGRIQRT
jgi:hypothetical protein